VTVSSSRDPIASYQPGTGVDELIGSDGVIRTHWNDLARAYVGLGTTELLRRRDEVALLLERDGVTYNVTADGQRHQPWELDPIPLVVPNDEWEQIEYGVRQRALILDLVMGDLYGGRRLMSSGVIPPVMVLDDPAFLRAADGITLPTPHQLLVTATDLVRTAEGGWMAMGNRTQAPSGAGYAIQNRNVISRVFPTIFRNAEALRLAPFVRTLRASLQAAAPAGVEDPVIVVLTPGPHAETAFEHAFLATQLGYPLVEGSDLVNRDGRIWLRTVSELAPVDVILRRVDGWFCDPLELLPESTLGVPGLVDAARTGNVSIVNPLGAGVMENAGIDTRLPELSRNLLGEELALPSVESWWCGEPSGASHVIANLGSMMVRPLSRRRAGGIAIDTRMLSRSGRSELAERIRSNPERWTGQRWVEPSTAPMLTATGLAPSPTVLRTFAVADGEDFLVMTGGLARTSSTTGPITNQRGAIAKDTWILSTEPESAGGFWLTGVGAPTAEPAAPLPSRAAENMFWLGRYSERAEAAVRLLRVVNTRRTEFEHAGSGPGVEAVAALLEGVTRVTTTYPGFVGDDAAAKLADPSVELFSLVVDANRPGTVAQATEKMFAAVEVLRDQLSVDTWLVIGSMQRSLERLERITAERDDAVDTVLSGLLESLLALAGLMAESMVRDHAWQFLEGGRRLERALQLTGLVAALLTTERDPSTESIVAESTLMAAESIITYRRRYRSHAQVSTLLDLLLLDPGNPRSLRYQLDRLVDTIGALDAARRDESTSLASALAFEASAVLDDIDTTILAGSVDGGFRLHLGRFLDEIRNLLLRIADAIGADNFTRLLPQHAVSTPAEPPVWN
jgi:uncharacterized circularly permuted ATP-grasp superfamily protein/uncharacterized alpha-E superfamily protein